MHIFTAFNSHNFTMFLLDIEYCARILGTVWETKNVGTIIFSILQLGTQSFERLESTKLEIGTQGT